MTSPEVLGHPSQGHLARVIPIAPHLKERSTSHAVDILERRVGPGWPALPVDGGGPALRAERLVRRAPCGFDPAEIPAATALARADHLVRGARNVLELLTDEVATLSEALGADLGSLSFDELDSVATAVLSLASAPPASPAWGNRAAADGAALVLALLGPDLQASTDAHEALYERFTDHVWEVRAELLVRGAHRWRPFARHRLRQQLRAASRTGTLPGPLGEVTREIVEVRKERARLAPLRPLLAHHLGHLYRGVLTDVEAAVRSLAAVRDLHRSLALLQDDGRMERLLLAGAFRTPELQVPSRSILTALAAWAGDVASASGRGAMALDGDTLEAWSDDVERDVPDLITGLDALEPLAPGATLRELVDVLVLREHEAMTAGSEDLAPQSADRSWGAP